MDSSRCKTRVVFSLEVTVRTTWAEMKKGLMCAALLGTSIMAALSLATGGRYLSGMRST